ncbi:hypothetical protein V5O48_017487, partial [Marasmius crinis-equi]
TVYISPPLELDPLDTMKFTVAIVFLATQLNGVFSVAIRDGEECGALGVMAVDGDATDVRKCANHPLGRDRFDTWESLAPIEANETSLTSRAEEKCFYDAPYGCSGGYCWKACGSPGDGKWCWTAGGDGSGAWLT